MQNQNYYIPKWFIAAFLLINLVGGSVFFHEYKITDQYIRARETADAMTPLPAVPWPSGADVSGTYTVEAARVNSSTNELVVNDKTPTTITRTPYPPVGNGR